MKRVLIVEAGLPPGPVRAGHGTFADWFAGLLAGRADVAAVDPRTDSLPGPAAFDGVLVTGSLASATRLEPWMERLGTWLLQTGEEHAVLGVCFGHQLLARALGGRVERHPAGPEAGVVEVALTAAGRADPLFQGLPSPFPAQELHEDHVAEAPPGATVLASTAHAPVQAFARGPRLRGVQFHPELDEERARALAAAVAPWLEAGRPGLAARALASQRPTPGAAGVVAGWVDAFVAG